MEYLSELIWLTVWPIILYSAYKISIRNVLKFEKTEQEKTTIEG